MTDACPDSRETFLCLNNRHAVLAPVRSFIIETRDSFTPQKAGHSIGEPYRLCDIEVIELLPAVLIMRVCADCGGVRQQRRGSSARTQSVTLQRQRGSVFVGVQNDGKSRILCGITECLRGEEEEGQYRLCKVQSGSWRKANPPLPFV